MRGSITDTVKSSCLTSSRSRWAAVPNNCVKPDLNDLGIIGQRVPQIDLEKCRGCKVCQVENNCPIKVAKLVDGKITIDDSACNHCGRCIGKCPFHAIENYTAGYRIYIGGRWGKKVAQGKISGQGIY